MTKQTFMPVKTIGLISVLILTSVNLAVAQNNDFEGVWSTNFGELRLRQDDQYIVGDYADRGIIVGKHLGNFVYCGHFTNGGRSGVFNFERAGGTFSGTWGWHDQPRTSSWTGNRTSSRPPSVLNNFSEVPIRVFDINRTDFNGMYQSNHGLLTLGYDDLVIYGNYADRGVIAGVWNGDAFVGQFTNDGNVGTFSFPFQTSGNATPVQGGTWSWVGRPGGGSWNLTTKQQGPVTPTLNIDCN